MADIRGVPGCATLIGDRLGEPALLRWLSIGPDGQVAQCSSDNNIAWSVEDGIWVQWRLVRDVHHAVDPTAPASGWVADLIRAGEYGMVIAARVDDRPLNPVANRMLAELGDDHTVRGTVAWVGPLDPDTGLHADLDDDQRGLLMAMAGTVRPDRRGGRP